jgi:hypothetical protein
MHCYSVDKCKVLKYSISKRWLNDKAVLAVKEKKLTISQASRDCSVPRKTIGK